LSYEAISYPQGSQESQKLFDQAIHVAPNYAWAYYEKSVPFFKRGMLSDGIWLINKAIELEPQNYLYYRAYWYFYNRSYDLCIRDLEELYSVHRASFTTIPSGEIEMRMLLAMSYAHTGNISKGIDWIQNLMATYQDHPHLRGTYDHFIFGALYFHDKQYELSEVELNNQIEADSRFADTYYYLGLIFRDRSENKKALEFFNKSLGILSGKLPGHCINFFTEFNVSQHMVTRELEQLIPEITD